MSSLLDKHIFNMKLSAKSLHSLSVKAEKSSKIERKKLQNAIKSNKPEIAKIYAENCIRHKQESVDYLRLSSRIDAVTQRLTAASAMQKVTQSMSGVVNSISSALKVMDLPKIINLMDKFESMFDTLDIQSQCMQNSMGATTTLSTPQDAIDKLIQEVADEHGLDVNMGLPNASEDTNTKVIDETKEDDLAERLAKLRNI